LLGDIAEEIAYEAAFWLEGLTTPSYPISELGDLSLSLSTKFRTLAIAAILAKSDTDLFYHNLIRSGICRQIYLHRVTKDDLQSDHHYCSGRLEPLLDAICGGDLTHARSITSLTPSEWYPEREYLEDFWYSRWIHYALSDHDSTRELEVLKSNLETPIDELTEIRIGVTESIAERDQQQFDGEFNQLLDHREQQIEKDIARGQFEDAEVVAQRLIYVEGLAILRIADHLGLETDLEYPFCPSLARLPMQRPFPPFPIE